MIAGGFHFGIPQAEVTDLVQFSEYLPELKKALESLRERQVLDFAMLMVTDVVRGSSRLLTINEPRFWVDFSIPIATGRNSPS